MLVQHQKIIFETNGIFLGFTQVKKESKTFFLLTEEKKYPFFNVQLNFFSSSKKEVKCQTKSNFSLFSLIFLSVFGRLYYYFSNFFQSLP